jgi:uncharacterized damage-inducible protein DinB
MQPISPEQATFLLNFLLPQIKNEHKTARRMIEALPAGGDDYRPNEASMSAFDLAWHLASADCFFLEAVADGEFRGGGARPETVRTFADIAEWYSRRFLECFNRVKDLTAEQLMKPISFHNGPDYAAVMYLQFGLNHSIHHRGQLSTYLRPMGAKVPSIYGGSADEPAKAASGR